MNPPPILVLFTGPPGTGKSTLADCTAGLLEAPVLGWDWVMAGMTSFDQVQATLTTLDHVTYRKVGWSILGNLARAQLREDRNVILDGVARQTEVVEIRRIASEEGARCKVILTGCSDPHLHQLRLQGRARAIPGWHELDWDDVARFISGWQPPSDVDLALDTSQPLRVSKRLVRGCLDAG
jgi:predicted kinase